MLSVNRVILVGNAGNDAKLGKAGESDVANFSLATHYRYKKGEEWTTRTTWHQVAVFGARAKAAAKHIKKGKLVAIEGRNDNQEISGANDQKYRTTRVVADDFDVDPERNAEAADAGPGLEPG